ncbi:RNA polymerase II [Nesidiocoris tenuis]|uniref:RNA polymerase II n=1 Tax=Nesidiocoris tenuis TaxID=355587 RepID=A0ABN7B895_9HEMI|nr:RNA polymerase II [Nesidiocoris tenuis]
MSSDLNVQLSQLTNLVQSLVQAQIAQMQSAPKQIHFAFEEFKPCGEESISSYFDRFKLQLQLSEIPETAWASYMRVHMGAELTNLLRETIYPETPEKLSYSAITEHLINYYKEKSNKYSEAIKFRKIIQDLNESVVDYARKLKVGARDCEFGNFLDYSLIVQFIHGVKDDCVRDAVIMRKPDKFSDALKLAEDIEATKRASSEVKFQSADKLHKLHKFAHASRPRSSNRPRSHVRNRSSSRSHSSHRSQDREEPKPSKCFGCGDFHWRKDCPFRSSVCPKCSRTGHSGKFCRNSRRASSRNDHSRQISEEINSQISTSQNFIAERQPSEYQPASAVTYFGDYESYNCVGEISIAKRPPPAMITVLCLGYVPVDVTFRQRTRSVNLYVAPFDTDNIFGREWISEFADLLSFEEFFKISDPGPKIPSTLDNKRTSFCGLNPILQKFEKPDIKRRMDDRGLNACRLSTTRSHLWSAFARRGSSCVGCWKTIELSTKDFTIASVNAFLEWRLVFSKSYEREPSNSVCCAAGETLVHCSSCCEAYHTFCASALKTDNSKESWWKLDWLCSKCTQCRCCSKYGGSQLCCANCRASYHFNCVSLGRANVLDNNWMCPDCLRCKSCNNPEFHVFVGNLPLCNACFNLRKKGNFCPLCQVCYDDDDYDTKMMECAECKKWVHAKCERISDEKYQILSYLPSSIEFVCRVCCTDPPPLWTEAVNAQLKLGLLNVIKALGKNQVVCNLVKASPMKKSCSCRSYEPVLLRNLNLPDELAPKADSESSTSDEKPADLNLLTPKLTKDDEECLDIVKSGFINLVSNKVEGKNYPTVYDFTEDDDDLPITRFEHRSRSLLSIASSESGVRSCSKSFKSAPTSDDELLDRACTCEPNDSSLSVLTVMEVKKRVQCNHYLSVKNFNEEMTQALDYIHADSVKAYRNSLKHVFPWFDPDNPLDTSFSDDPFPLPVEGSPSKISATRMADSGVDAVKKPQCTWNDLLVHDPDYYYVNCKIEDVRLCMFCKEVGEGLPSKEGRLLYCGHNEWVHVNCALWSSEVFEEIDGSLQNVQSAISRSRMIRCCFCDKKGASVGCCARSCPSTYHLSCALQSNCVFLSNKEVYCKIHSHMRGKKDLQNREDFCVSRPVYVELDQKKRKEILHSGVKLAIGSLFIHLLGEIIPECSDLRDVIVPCNFRCARWFWSAEEPWRLVRYFVETKTSSPACEYSVDQDINVTIENSSVGITPPPSPRDPESRSNYNCIADRVEIRNLLNQLVDTVCAREEECNLAEQQGTDLLPPDIEEAIFKDLPHDILDGIDMQDIFPKISFDDFSECKIDKAEVDGETPSNKKSIKEETKPINLKIHKIAKVQKSCKDPGVVNGAQSIDCDTYNWKTSTILQLDGAVDDSSDSEQSVDSCEAQSMNFLRADEPVKCGRCRRTYRSSIGYDRHLPECNSDFSDTDSNEEEQEDVKQNLDVHVGCFKLVKKNENVLDDTMEKNDEDCTESDDGSCNSQTTGRLDVIVDVYEDCMPEPIENGVTLAEVADAVNIPQSSAIIVQEVPHETVMPQYMPAFTSQAAIQQPEIQYFSPPNPNGFQYPGSVPSAVIPSVPSTMLSAIGVDQIMLNSPSPVYQQPPQNNVYIANPSLVVGMETVVSNTVMSSSQFIPGVPGMLASSYSTTTTQVFHAAKPQIDLPPNFVIVNAQPVVNSAPGLTNLPNYVQDNVSAGTPWNNYQMNVQESHVVSNNCSSYQTVTRKIVHEHKNVDGVKMINSTQETVFIEPIVHTNSIQQQYNCSVKNFNHIPQSIVEKDILTTPSPKPSQPKVVELPRMPTTNREKPQQAVAPVVIKQIVSTPPSSETSPATTVPTIEKTEPEPEQNPPSSKKPNVSLKTEENGLKEVAVLSPNKELLDTGSLASPPPPPSPLKSENESIDMKPSLGLFSEEDKPNHRNGLTIKTLKVEVQRSTIHDTRPKITYEVTSEDGFSCSSSDIHSAWEKIYDRVQNSRKCRGLPPLGKNPFGDTNSVLKKAIGLGNNSVKFIVEQLPGASSCTNYRPVYHKKKLSALEQELSRNRPNENYRGCARADIYPHKQHTYDMFSWLASRHRRPPKLTNFDVDIINSNRRASLSLPIAMRFRYLKETSKHTVGVFRSDIHGRGLFCLRDIESGEMVIEYAGEVIRSTLTDMRERFYTDKGIGCYMFRIDDKSVIDATMKGNAARFINHSCEPNCYSKVVDIFGKKRIVIFALRKIIQGEELTYDYKFPLEEDKIKCHCLSKRCRKYLN